MNSAYFWLAAIFPDDSISYMVWSRHFTSSVGQRTSAAKAEAKEPAAAFWRSLQGRKVEYQLIRPFGTHTTEEQRMGEWNLCAVPFMNPETLEQTAVLQHVEVRRPQSHTSRKWSARDQTQSA